MSQSNKLPRELSPGVFWLGDCLEQHSQGKVYHGYNSAFLLVGSRASMLIETGHPKDFPIIALQLQEVLADKAAAPLKHLFLTHQETPHSGGLGRILEIYPEVTIHGDVADYHFAFPQYVERLRAMEVGDCIDLGNREFMAVEPVIRDLRTSLWGFDTKDNVLFPGDGFAYSHYHWDGHCGMTAEEAQSLDLAETSAVFAERALFWTKFADMNIYVDKLEELIRDLDAKLVAPTHGLPVTNIPVTLPKIRAGLVAGSIDFD
ncbi:MAG: MBL fold metallo-hydrolase [Hyphomicrobiaceae bacterium]